MSIHAHLHIYAQSFRYVHTFPACASVPVIQICVLTCIILLRSFACSTLISEVLWLGWCFSTIWVHIRTVCLRQSPSNESASLGILSFDRALIAWWFCPCHRQLKLRSTVFGSRARNMPSVNVFWMVPASAALMLLLTTSSCMADPSASSPVQCSGGRSWRRCVGSCSVTCEDPTAHRRTECSQLVCSDAGSCVCPGHAPIWNQQTQQCMSLHDCPERAASIRMQPSDANCPVVECQLSKRPWKCPAGEY